MTQRKNPCLRIDKSARTYSAPRKRGKGTSVVRWSRDPIKRARQKQYVNAWLFNRLEKPSSAKGPQSYAEWLLETADDIHDRHGASQVEISAGEEIPF